MRAKDLLGIGLILLLAFAAPLTSQTWIKLNPTPDPTYGSPLTTSGHGAVYNPTTNRMIIFGGFHDFGAYDLTNDLWVLTNADGTGGKAAWIKLTPGGGPSVRWCFGGAAYDQANNRMIVHGGFDRPGYCDSALHDTWVLTNADGTGGSPAWTQISTGGPSLRNHTIVYDPADNRLIVHGGMPGGCGQNNDYTWVMTNANGLGGTPVWTKLAPSGEIAYNSFVGPIIMGYQSDNNVLVELCFDYSGGSWVTEVRLLSNANGLGDTPAWTTVPPYNAETRWSATGIYDAARNKMILFGGANGSTCWNEALKLSHADGQGGTAEWTQLYPAGIPPEARTEAAAVYNPLKDRVIFFGGRNNCTSKIYNDAWVLVLPRADIALTKSADNLIPLEGGEVNFTVTATNNGPDYASGLTVTDLLPAALTYVSSDPSLGTYDPDTGVWDIDYLAEGDTATLTIKVTGNDSGDVVNTAARADLDETDLVTSNDSASATVNFSTPVTITTSPAGLDISIDAVSYTAPQTFHWAASSMHTISVFSPQSGSTGTRYWYASWSDAGTQSHSIATPSSATTYTATFTTQYLLTTTANPGAGGSVTPAGTNWYDANQAVQVQATSNSGYVFTGWSGDRTGTANPDSVTMNGPKTVTANFISGKTLNPPVLAEPANNATGQPQAVTLKWQDTNSSPQELKYKVRIKPAGGAYKNYTVTANTVSYLKSGLLKNKTYYWSVQALGKGTSIKNSVWPADWKFATAK